MNYKIKNLRIEIWEDNAGGLDVVVFNKRKLIDYRSGWEIFETGEELLVGLITDLTAAGEKIDSEVWELQGFGTWGNGTLEEKEEAYKFIEESEHGFNLVWQFAEGKAESYDDDGGASWERICKKLTDRIKKQGVKYDHRNI